jgi:hypothetical protein
MNASLDQVAVHTRLGNDYRNWMHTAQTLFAATTILRRERERVRAELRLGGRAPIELLTVWTELMLAAFGIECLVKAIWVKQGNWLACDGKYVPMLPREGHRLVPLCHAARISLDPREEDVLRHISVFGRSIARFPIARHFRETEGLLSWSTNDDQVVERFVLRLKKELRRRGTETTKAV